MLTVILPIGTLVSSRLDLHGEDLARKPQMSWGKEVVSPPSEPLFSLGPAPSTMSRDSEKGPAERREAGGSPWSLVTWMEAMVDPSQRMPYLTLESIIFNVGNCLYTYEILS